MFKLFCCTLLTIVLSSTSFGQSYSDAIKFAEAEKNVDRIDKKPEYIVIYYKSGGDLYIKQFNFQYSSLLKDNAVFTEVDIYNSISARDKAVQTAVNKGFKKSQTNSDTYKSSDGRIALILKEPSADTNYKPMAITSYASFFE